MCVLSLNTARLVILVYAKKYEEFKNSDIKTFSNSELIDKYRVVFFVYTRCTH
ncbi:hypothetical protein GPUN_1220 [Glaciecola punicea ACAM 611]|uniref:Uncharacterized protein n=1 Tax=Glaciecola punicea ACAM 611 TaxID=1121923 RepID=H5TAL7_9ALTE|nr:hypothetical protein GPUN_1220 [Glaciecola punicea ACAM 611]